MDPRHGFVLGIVQGLTEPLPISSSAHLILVPWLIGWPDHSLTFDVALHMGTLAALILFFWRDWWALATAWLPARARPAFAATPLAGGSTATGSNPTACDHAGGDRRALDRRLGAGLVVGTIPAAVAGVLFEDVIEQSLRAPVLVALVLIVASAAIFAADRLGSRTLGVDAVTYLRALAVGTAQAFALAPGVSRSGITIAAGLALGLTRYAAARYAFLLAAPVTAGAGVFKLRHLFRDGIPPDERGAFAAGIITSFVVGLVAIRFLLTYLRHHSMSIFIVYRVALALLVLLLAAGRIA